MEEFPITWLVSVLTAVAAYVLAWDARLPLRARVFLCLFLLCLSSIAVLLGMRVSFDWLWPANLQPFVAILPAPAAYLGFVALMQDSRVRWKQTLLRNGGLIGVALLGLLLPLPASQDVFILAVNSIYLVGLARLLGRSRDDFSAVPDHATNVLRAAIYTTIALVGLMVAADGLVFAVSLVARDTQLMEFLTGVSGLFAGFILVVALVGIPLLLRGRRNGGSLIAAPSDADRALMLALDRIMKSKELFRDSNLTLARVAKRLSVPARDLSGATNRVTGENFSRLITGYRIDYAKRALLASDLPITEIMYEAGFLSKSSFNTEFRRMIGQTPSQFRAKETAT